MRISGCMKDLDEHQQLETDIELMGFGYFLELSDGVIDGTANSVCWNSK